MNKQGLWFLTLFSLILVLSVYYITMPSEIFKSSEIVSEQETDDKKEAEVSKNKTTSKENESKQETKEEKEVNTQTISYIETLKVELDSERAEIVDTLQSIMNDKTKSSDEKNQAYEEMKQINSLKASEASIMQKIKDEYSLNSYVKQENSNIEVVVEGKSHDVKLANKIMRTVQSSFEDPKSITVKFSKN